MSAILVAVRAFTAATRRPIRRYVIPVRTAADLHRTPCKHRAADLDPGMARDGPFPISMHAYTTRLPRPCRQPGCLIQAHVHPCLTRAEALRQRPRRQVAMPYTGDSLDNQGTAGDDEGWQLRTSTSMQADAMFERTESPRNLGI
ncbi:hypothetical protein [Dokdonella koreensis]|uniref:hypothetical protein n=1 Tax=Dokdonella koreensis TaxID=323415 RepID=UPI00123787FF|nr:hypothetical protein [Dokdonella koreensis]